MNRLRRSLLLLTLFSALVVLASSVLPAAAPTHAQDYSFSVPRLHMDVYVQPDASARLVYDITFENAPGAHPIDIVDIGLPHDDYTISTMQASIDGHPLSQIQTSTYIGTGVEVHLGNHDIAPGGQGTLHFEATMPDMVYQDTTNADMASLRVTPTWFDSSLVRGSGDIRVAIHLPPGVQADEMLYHNENRPFTNKEMVDDRLVGVWEVNRPATSQYNVGISFPKRVMDRVVEISTLDLLFRWFDSPFASSVLFPILGVVFYILLFIMLIRVTGWNGIITIFVLIFFCGGGGGLLAVAFNPCIIGIGYVLLIPLFPFAEWYVRRRKRKYLPAIAQVEGGGIKRGLTAPEAATLLEMPPNKVLALIIFGLLKKGIVRQVDESPLRVEVVEEFSEKDDDELKKLAQQKGIVIHAYEPPFIKALDTPSPLPVHEINFKAAMKNLIKHVLKRVEKFDLSDTRDYYRRVIRHALEQAQAVGDIPTRDKVLDRDMEWILLNEKEDYTPTFQRPGYRYVPIWIRSSGSSGGHIPSSPSSAPSSGGGDTSFGDVAASFAGWTENTFGKMADAVTPDMLKPPPPKSSSSSSKGGGCVSCACACAGCACACACAGGGR